MLWSTSPKFYLQWWLSGLRRKLVASYSKSTSPLKWSPLYTAYCGTSTWTGGFYNPSKEEPTYCGIKFLSALHFITLQWSSTRHSDFSGFGPYMSMNLTSILKASWIRFKFLSPPRFLQRLFADPYGLSSELKMKTSKFLAVLNLL